MRFQAFLKEVKKNNKKGKKKKTLKQNKKAFLIYRPTGCLSFYNLQLQFYYFSRIVVQLVIRIDIKS